eukprot:6909354-Ditylum_brightwellii.AAC.1
MTHAKGETISFADKDDNVRDESECISPASRYASVSNASHGDVVSSEPTLPAISSSKPPTVDLLKEKHKRLREERK